MKEKITKHDREVDRKNLGHSGHHKKMAHHLEKAGHYLTKMSEAGHKYNESKKHREREARGMRGK